MDSNPNGAALLQAQKDMQALIDTKRVIDRWSDYQEAFDRAFAIYRDAYVESYSRVRNEVSQTVADIKSGASYLDAPAERREAVVARVFGEGKVCHYPQVSVLAVATLLDAAGRRSLTSLGQTLVALPAYRAQVEAELRSLSSPPPPSGEKIYEWRSSELLGRRFKTEKEIDSAIDQIRENLKARVRDGYTIVIK